MAILRLKYQAENSIVPPRLSQVDLIQFGHTGFVRLDLIHEGHPYSFKIPFIRPFKKRPILSSTVNLNGGSFKNMEFEEFQERINPDFQNDLKIDCKYTILK